MGTEVAKKVLPIGDMLPERCTIICRCFLTGQAVKSPYSISLLLRIWVNISPVPMWVTAGWSTLPMLLPKEEGMPISFSGMGKQSKALL